MKKQAFPTIVAFLALLLVGCAKKKHSDYIIVPKIETPEPQGPIRMQADERTKDIVWLGKNYQVAIRRAASDSLPTVQDETGQQFVDNCITLRVVRSDSSVFFSRTFTKATFDAQLDDDYRKTGILEGIVFNKVDGNNLVFAGSVSHPLTDEYIPLVITVSNFGDVVLKRDDQMDTSGSLPSSSDDDDNDDDGI